MISQPCHKAVAEKLVLFAYALLYIVGCLKYVVVPIEFMKIYNILTGGGNVHRTYFRHADFLFVNTIEATATAITQMRNHVFGIFMQSYDGRSFEILCNFFIQLTICTYF